MMGWSGGGRSPLGGVVTVVFWLAVLALIVWLVGRIFPGVSGETTGPPTESELEVLDRQLASGEIEVHAGRTNGALSWPPKPIRKESTMSQDAGGTVAPQG